MTSKQPARKRVVAAPKALGRRDSVYYAIRQAITSRKYLPAQRLVEADLAEQFQVSKTPIREALYRLEQDGLVQSVHNRGFTVRTITPDEMRNIYELRELYEGACARAAAVSEQSAEVAAQLRSYNEAAAAALTGDDIQRVHANFYAFDELIVAQSPNELLREQFERLAALISLGGTMSNLIPGRTKRSLGEHEAIAAAIAIGDADAAELLTRDHIRSILADQLRATAGYLQDGRSSG